jgi:putative PIN family toxin of toxin-antitoxin system
VLKVTVDSNVWVSALLTPGNARKVVNCLKKGRFRLVYTNEIFDELIEVLARKKFAKKLIAQDREDLIDLIKQRGMLIRARQLPATISRDQKDDKFLVCSIASKCNFLVGGDKDLLCLAEYADVRIISPAQFLKMLQF